MSRTDEGKESETNEDKQKNEVRDTFTTVISVLIYVPLVTGAQTS